ncbi:MAG: MFS transporter [Candidatus Paceibacterota bacterium]
MHLKKINKIIKYLILSDLALWSGLGLVTPVFAIFILERVGGTALSVGIAVSIYWVVKSLFQYPAGLFLDHRRGDTDDYLFLVFGTFIVSMIPFAYLLATTDWHVYVFQFFYGIGMAMCISGWRAIFTRNIDKGHEAADWSLDDAVLGFGTGISGLVSGYLVYKFGFVPSFIVAGTCGLIGVIFLICLRKDIVGNFDKKRLLNFFKIFSKRIK